uniref:Uncharacterized protein n=1 Tax=Cajanus cajan TaxID=3821 RepID=A0A151RL15_CAJCA|nr:hypothetical protein KK1_035414 [Cajanus cajan]
MKWQVVCYAISWCVWKHKNLCIFRQGQFDRSKLMEDIISTSWSWLKFSDNSFQYPFSVWSTNPDMCLCKPTF